MRRVRTATVRREAFRTCFLGCLLDAEFAAAFGAGCAAGVDATQTPMHAIEKDKITASFFIMFIWAFV